MNMSTSDLCDQFSEKLQVASPVLRHYGGVSRFHGKIVTIKCYEDNSYIREAALEDGNGKILVIDGGGSLRSALVGDGIATWALNSGWSGLIINGCIRDSQALAKVKIGVMALGINPWQPSKRNEGLRNIVVTFADVYFRPDEYLWADEDGFVTSAENLIIP